MPGWTYQRVPPTLQQHPSTNVWRSSQTTVYKEQGLQLTEEKEFERSVRQGSSLLPLVYVLALESAREDKENQTITGIKAREGDERRNDRVRQAHNGPNQYKEIQGEIEEDDRTEKKQRTEPRRKEETSINKPNTKPPGGKNFHSPQQQDTPHKTIMSGQSIIFKEESAHEDSIWSCAFGRNERDPSGSETVVTGSIDDYVKVWKWQDERLELRHTLEGHQLGVVSVDINSDGSLAASSSLDSHVRIWDLDSGKMAKSIDAGPVDAYTIAFSPDSRFLASGSHTGKINLFGVDTGRKESSMDTRGKFTLSLAYSPDGKFIASGALDGIVNVFDIRTGKLIHTLEGHAMPIRSLCFSPDSQLLITASDDCQIKIYDVQHANLAGTLSGHGSWVLSVDFCADNTHFVSGSSDKTVKIWNAGTRQCVHTFHDHMDQVWGVKYNPSGSKIVSVSDDRNIHMYDCPL
ncbi:hypothetical protein RRG08_054126 [Elysia crispata]|uniref:WD repeat-containing protein 61 n=1 Tax=Elysia crispata TaxID=231223 RepID=A0AAE0Y8G0_9GAST|nr:hypothetical protein RRG08_054126 [Elysia crispata]